MKARNSISFIIICIALAGCKADMICPAYQSYFFLDEMAQKDQFTYFALDSLPRRDLFYTTSDKNGLVAKNDLLAYADPTWSRNRELKTVNMEVIYPQISDSLLFSGDVMMYAETDVIDSAALDSARMAAQTFQYNVDQKYYNWYFRDKLVWKDELDGSKEKTGLSSPQPAAAEPVLESEEKKGIGGMFKKKEKQPKEPKQKKVKSKKEKKVDEPDIDNKPTPPPVKEEEEDDGEDDF